MSDRISKKKESQIIKNVAKQPKREALTKENVFRKASKKTVSDKQFRSVLGKMTGIFDEETGDEDRVVIIGIHRGRISTHTDRLFYTGSRSYLASLFCQLFWMYDKEAKQEQARLTKGDNAS